MQLRMHPKYQIWHGDKRVSFGSNVITQILALEPAPFRTVYPKHEYVMGNLSGFAIGIRVIDVQDGNRGEYMASCMQT